MNSQKRLSHEKVESLKSRYLKLESKLGSSSVDYGRQTIYSFDKYCKACGKGLIKKISRDKLLRKGLWRKSFCSEDCMELGKAKSHLFPITVKESHGSTGGNNIVEEMAFLRLKIEREEGKIHPIIRLVKHAEETLHLLSEKIRFMEEQTSQKWYPSLYYYWRTKI